MALLEQLRVHGARAIAAAGPHHFDFIKSPSGEPIESRKQPLDHQTAEHGSLASARGRQATRLLIVDGVTGKIVLLADVH